MDITDILLFSAEVDCLMYLLFLVFYTCGTAPRVRSALCIPLTALLRLRQALYFISYLLPIVQISPSHQLREEMVMLLYLQSQHLALFRFPCLIGYHSPLDYSHLTTVIPYASY